MKIIYNKFIPSKNYLAINLFGVIFARKIKKPITKRLINHESIHTAQGKELLWIFFYLWYVLEWIIRFIQYKNTKDAYLNISFEREAYTNEGNLNYLKDRKAYSFLNYYNETRLNKNI